MELWTEIIDPATLTGYIRESLADIEQRKGTLVSYLPNELVDNTFVEFIVGQAGLVEEARFRAFDAEVEIGRREGGQLKNLKLPAIGQKLVVSEYEQLMLRHASDESIRNAVMKAADQVSQAIADAIERMRGVVLATGKATLDQSNYRIDDDFGRDAALTTTVGTLWSDPNADPIADLETLMDLYIDKNGVEPGTLLMSQKVFRRLQTNKNFATLLVNGANRAATADEAKAQLAGAGLPEVDIYNRRTSSGPVLPDNLLLMLPAKDDTSSQLGKTFWGAPLPPEGFNLPAGQLPGANAGVYRNNRAPVIAEIEANAIALPVLANANLSLAAKVL